MNGKTSAGGPAHEAGPSASAAREVEIAALKDRLLRALAETENVRRCAEKDVGDARQYAIAISAE